MLNCYRITIVFTRVTGHGAALNCYRITIVFTRVTGHGAALNCYRITIVFTRVTGHGAALNCYRITIVFTRVTGHGVVIQSDILEIPNFVENNYQYDSAEVLENQMQFSNVATDYFKCSYLGITQECCVYL